MCASVSSSKPRARVRPRFCLWRVIRFGVALKAFFRPEAASDLKAKIELRFDDGTFVARVDQGSLVLEPGSPNGADLVLKTEVETLIAFLAGADVPPAALAPEGDTALLERLPRIFAFGLAA